MNEKKCKVLAAEIRLETLKVIHSRGFGHVGGSMDLADLMAVLYGEVMKFDPKNPRWEDRDWLVPVSYTHLDVYKRQAPGPLTVEQAMGISLGDGVIHQLQAGVAAHEHLSLIHI